MTGRVAILIVNGFDRGGRWGPYDPSEAVAYPWIKLCLDRVERHTSGHDYCVMVYDNSQLVCHRDVVSGRRGTVLLPCDDDFVEAAGGPEAEARLAPLRKQHSVALDYLVAHLGEDVEFVITLDTDAFPVRDGWIDVLTSLVDDGATISGVYRDEMVPRILPFIHVSCLCMRLRDLRSMRASFARGFVRDVGVNLTKEVLAHGGTIAPLRRSNARNAHFLMGGIYGDLVYHHGAGSRRAVFWTSTDIDADERTRIALRDAVFADPDCLVDVLRGERDDPYGWQWID